MQSNITTTDLISKNVETFSIDGQTITDTVYTVPVGATISVSGSTYGLMAGVEDYVSIGANAYETEGGGIADLSINIASNMLGSFFKYFTTNVETKAETHAYIRVGNQQSSPVVKDPDAQLLLLLLQPRLQSLL